MARMMTTMRRMITRMMKRTKKIQKIIGIGSVKAPVEIVAFISIVYLEDCLC